MTNADGPDIEVYPLRSRVLRTVYYDLAKQKMILELTQGKMRVYKNIEEDLVKILVTHPAPGVLYEKHLKAALKPLLCNTAAQLLFLRQVRQISKLSGERTTML